MATSAKFKEYESCSVGDVVFVAPDIAHPFAAGKVHMLISISGSNHGEELAALVESWQYIRHTDRCTKWKTSDAPLKFVFASRILHTGIWSHTGSIASLLVPMHMKR